MLAAITLPVVPVAARGPGGGEGLVRAVLVAGTIHLVVVLQRKVSLSAMCPTQVLSLTQCYSAWLFTIHKDLACFLKTLHQGLRQLLLKVSWDLRA